ncbi:MULTISPECIES: nickel ABC transporter permease [Clostridium]|uniref:nickel ABC transporter permease n=1 Tax=Clostridium TaxID=1485 RepID=UPI0008269E29|nr:MULTISPECIES: nickel ABC transporter permease [Clostridium]PJI09276.1 ABC transporter permease [Clostridium sp. CT7]
MARFILKRLGQLIAVLFIVSIIVFIVTRVIPGDPAAVMLGPQAPKDAVVKMRESLGLNKPLIMQYGKFLLGILHGDLGDSIYYHEAVLSLILERFPNTVLLASASLLIALVVSIPVGIISATRKNSIFDYVSMLFSLIGVSMPVFWLGLMLVLLFSVKLGILPATGMGSLSNGVWDFISHLILPSVALSTVSMGTFARITRSSMLEVIGEDYIRTARAKGLSEKLVIWKHALRNALIPLLTVVGMQISSLLGGAVLTETIFAWPGIGRLIVDSIEKRDYQMVQGTVLFVVVIFVIVNLIVDILYVIVNPKLSFSEEGSGK